jgi:serine/threonine protein kinase/Tfp pilus assembly protein PilF
VSSPSPKADPHLSRYQITEQIGTGGMGVVYLAYDKELEREVALKFLYADAANNSRELLLQEARLSSRLNHPNICTIYDVGEADGNAYIAMEYVAGRELSSFIRGDALPTETIIQFGLQLADALGYAHDQGVIHRDFKSSNVAVTKQHRVKILDFGLAHYLEPVTPNGQTQTIPAEPPPVQGTLQYAAPEVLRRALPDARSDLWSLGVVLYEMATGKLPFTGATFVEIQSAILRDAPDMAAVRTPGLAAIISRCLAKDPIQRYQRASELHAALQTLASVGNLTLPREDEEEQRTARPRWWIGSLVTVLLVATAALAYHFWPRSSATQFESIAVLPLANLSGDVEQDYLVDGMTDILITDLAKIKAFKRVISRNSVVRYKKLDNTSLKQVANELNVDALLTGSVLRQNDRVRITLQLIDPRVDRLIWAEDYDGNLADMFGLEGRIALAVAEQVKLTLTPQERQNLGSTDQANSDASIAYLKGRYYWNKRDLPDLEKSREYFQQAIKLDPGYALAYAGLADYYVILTNQGIHEYTKAKAAAAKALEIDPDLAEAHTALAFVTFLDQYNSQAAEAEFKRSMSLNPNYATTFQWYAILLTFNGRTQEALAAAQRAQELDPLSLTINSYYGYALYLNRQFSEAHKQFEKTLELDSNFAITHHFYARLLVAENKVNEAINHAQRAVSLDPEIPAMRTTLAYAEAAAGKQDQARQILLALRKNASEPLPAEASFAYARLHDDYSALSTLENASREGMLWSVSLPSEPALDALRSNARFAKLWSEVKAR